MFECDPTAILVAVTERTPDPVDLIRHQWAAVRPELDTVPMGVLGRIYRIANAGRAA